MDSEKFPILVIDDEATAVKALSARLLELKISFTLEAMRTGEEALQFLDGRTAVQGSDRRELPGLIVLDSTLPGEETARIFGRIRGHYALRLIPIIVCAKSEIAKEIREAEKTVVLSKGFGTEDLKKALN